MNKGLLKLLFVAVVASVLFGCGSYNKLLKSDDKDLKYSKALEYYNAKKYQRTLQLFEDIAHYYSGTTKEDSISYYTGASHYKMGDFESSSMLFDDFRRRFGRSPFVEDAEYMYAKGFYYSSPQPERDQAMTHRALVAMNEYMERYPLSVKKETLQNNVKELTQKLHDKSFINAKTYYTTGRYKSAVKALKIAIDQYPESSHREDLLYLATKSSYLLANNSTESMQRDRYMEMMDDYFNFVSEFPQSKYVKELDKMQAEAKAHLAKYNID